LAVFVDLEVDSVGSRVKTGFGRLNDFDTSDGRCPTFLAGHRRIIIWNGAVTSKSNDMSTSTVRVLHILCVLGLFTVSDPLRGSDHVHAVTKGI